MEVQSGRVLWIPSPWNFWAWERGSYSLTCRTSVPRPLHSFPTLRGDILGTQLHEGQHRVAGHNLVPVFFQPDLFLAAIVLSFREHDNVPETMGHGDHAEGQGQGTSLLETRYQGLDPQ